MKIKIWYAFFAIISLVFLMFMSVLTFAFAYNVKTNTKSPQINDTVYVYVSEEQESEIESESALHYWIVKEYNEKIGIFDKNGDLFKIIDVYIKALPKSDQAALREGIEIKSEKELYSIIEAYSD